MSFATAPLLSRLLHTAVLCVLACALVIALPACRRRRVAPTATMPSMAQTTAADVSLARTARRALGCPDYEGWPLAPRLVLVQGCGRTAELFMVDDAGSLWLPVPSLTELAEEQLQCGAQLLDTVVLPGVARRVGGCGRSREFELHCRAAGCSWHPRGAEASVPEGYAVASATRPPFASASTATPTVGAPAPSAVRVAPVQPAPPPAPRPDPTRAIGAHIDGAREALQRCAWGSYTIRARWNRSGGVEFSLSEPLAGTPAEVCVRAALAMDRVETDQPGELDVVVP